MTSTKCDACLFFKLTNTRPIVQARFLLLDSRLFFLNWLHQGSAEVTARANTYFHYVSETYFQRKTLLVDLQCVYFGQV